MEEFQVPLSTDGVQASPKGSILEQRRGGIAYPSLSFVKNPSVMQVVAAASSPLRDLSQDLWSTTPAGKPTFSKGKDSDLLEEAWQVSMKLFVDWMQELPLTWKAYLQSSAPLPPLPPQVIATYAATSPPPLLELCPVDFEMRSWGSFKHDMEQWLDQQPDDASQLAPDPSAPSDFRGIIGRLLAMARRGSFYRGIDRATSLGCLPDTLIADPCGQVKLVGVMAGMEINENDPGSFEIHVARVYSYMLLTGCYFGIVSCYTKTFVCKRIPGICKCVWVSPGIRYDSGDVLKACAFVTWLCENSDGVPPSELPGVVPASPGLQDPSFFASTGPRAAFDRAPIIARLRMLGRQMSVANMDEILRRLVWWDCIQVEQASRLMRMSITGIYKERFVVVKLRDLSNSKMVDTDSNLRKFLREVDAYMRLRSVQGQAVPELLEFGFIRGAMVCFVILTDHRRLLRRQRPQMRYEKPEEDIEHEISVVKSHLSKVHYLHVHFGGQPEWLSSDTGNEFVLLGMSRACVDGDCAAKAKDMNFVDELISACLHGF